jgi:cell division GTPase FtsZ
MSAYGYFEHSDQEIQENVIAIADALDSKGWLDIDIHQAQTGTVYITATKWMSLEDAKKSGLADEMDIDNAAEDGDDEISVEVKIRCADHGECYCREDIDVSPTGVTAEEAIAKLN